MKKYVDENLMFSFTETLKQNILSAVENKYGIPNGIAPLNSKGKIDKNFLPNYTEVNYIASDTASSLTAKQTWTSEQTYNYEDYNLVLQDTISGIACGFKAPRGLFNQCFIDDIVFTRGQTGSTVEKMANEIGFYIWNGVDSQAATKDEKGNITEEGYNLLQEYTKIASITNDGGLVLKSSTPNSKKYFKLTIDDNGVLSIKAI